MGLFNVFMTYCKRYIFNSKGVSASIALSVALAYLFKAKNTQRIPEVKLSQFLEALQSNLIQDILINGTQVFFRSFNSQDWYQANATIITKERWFKLLKDKPQTAYQFIDSKKIPSDQLFYVILFTAAIGYSLGLILANQILKNPFAQGKKNNEIKFKNIYGLSNAKKQLFQVIEYLSNPQKYKNVGARLRRGVMIYGPPGTGKTMLAKATANESQVKFLYCSATEFMEIYVGMGAKRVRELFNRARQQAPSIIFIDEIDSIAYQRKNSNFGMEQGSESERVNTLNQLLTELDGFKENEDIVVIAATNRISILDDALMRAGRFDIKIQISLPNYEDRLGILEIHLMEKKQEISQKCLESIAQQTQDYSGADMENITNEAAYTAIENNKEIISDEDIEMAFSKIKKQKNYLSDANYKD